MVNGMCARVCGQWHVCYGPMAADRVKTVCERTVHVKVVHPASEGMRATVNISDVETGADIAQPVLAALQDECDRGSVSS